jgi:hypothetical protein
MNVIGNLDKKLVTRYDHHRDGVVLELFRQRLKSGSFDNHDRVHVGPNMVHVLITRKDGSVEDVGISKNLLTNIGRDVWSGSWGFQPAGATLASYVSSAVDATSITTTGTVLTASNLATPQLGVAGCRVYATPHTTTNPLVWGNAVSNTTSKITIDQWWKFAVAAAGPPVVATTPTVGDSFVIAPASPAGIQFMALSTNASAASASDTTLANEVTTNGGGRVYAAYAHTFGGTTLTLSNTFSFSGTITAVHKGGLFTALTAAGADPLIYTTVFNLDFTVGNGDTAACTWTITPSG